VPMAECSGATGLRSRQCSNCRAVACVMDVVEVPGSERVRLNGLSDLHAFRDGARILKTIMSERRSTRGLLVRLRQPASASPAANSVTDLCDEKLGLDRRHALVRDLSP